MPGCPRTNHQIEVRPVSLGCAPLFRIRSYKYFGEIFATKSNCTQYGTKVNESRKILNLLTTTAITAFRYVIWARTRVVPYVQSGLAPMELAF